MNGTDIANAIVDAKTTGALPRRAAFRPAGLIAAKTPIEEKKSEFPRTVLERCRMCLKSGIREINVPTAKPLRIKVRLTANLALLKSLLPSDFSAKLGNRESIAP